MSEVRADNVSKINSYAGLKPVSTFLISLSLILGIFIGVVGTSILGFFDRALFTSDKDTTENVEIEKVSNEDNLDEDYVNNILKIFEERYIKDLGEYENENLTYGAIKGIISTLDDPYTNFLTPKEAKDYLSQRSGDFEGIGITLSFKDGYSYIESVLQDHPAEKAGLLPMDYILEVDGEDMTGKYPSEVANKIRGDKGTEVKLKVLRQKENQETLDFKVTRDAIEIDNVMWKDLGNGYAQITIVQFNDESIDAFNKSWDKVVNEITSKIDNLKGVVVDVRNNPGGYVSSVQYVLEEFLDEGDVLMKEKSKNQDEVVYKDKRKGKFENLPVVVLVNEGSASASEIFAEGIRENAKGKIVGMPTVGKGVEQELLQLSDGSILLIVFQKWLTPKGNEISKGNPVQPDEKIDYSVENFEKGEDPQLKKALEIIN